MHYLDLSELGGELGLELLKGIVVGVVVLQQELSIPRQAQAVRRIVFEGSTKDVR